LPWSRHRRARLIRPVGIDAIGGILTEINVTLPTGIRAVKNFGAPRHRRADLGQNRRAKRK
jgi:hypothetical protein